MDTGNGGGLRRWRWLAALGVVLALAAARAPASVVTLAQGPSPTRSPGTQAEAILALVRDAMTQYDLRAVIVRVVVDGQGLVTEALGESMTGVPATTDMHFRNGAVAISYMSTLLLQLVDRGMARLDDPLSTWMPELPDSDQVTLRMLANMTAGYPDHVSAPGFSAELYADPYRQLSPQDLLTVSLRSPRLFAPGTNWAYSHTNYVILGQAMERIGGQPLATLIRDYILVPQGLLNTANWYTPEIPPPVLHAFTSERREALRIPPGTRFYEESTYWNPSWTLAEGAIETTNIYDMAASATFIGQGTLLSAESYQAQTAPTLRGFGHPLAGCPTCFTLNEDYTYGLGIVVKGAWLMQNPLFFGASGVMAYLPSRRIAIAVANTYGEQSFDDQGNYKYGNASEKLFAAIATYLAPDDPPPYGTTSRLD